MNRDSGDTTAKMVIVKTKKEQRSNRGHTFVLLGLLDSVLIGGVLYVIFTFLQKQRQTERSEEITLSPKH